jgi:hypothetical protein
LACSEYAVSIFEHLHTTEVSVQLVWQCTATAEKEEAAEAAVGHSVKSLAQQLLLHLCMLQAGERSCCQTCCTIAAAEAAAAFVATV